MAKRDAILKRYTGTVTSIKKARISHKQKSK